MYSAPELSVAAFPDRVVLLTEKLPVALRNRPARALARLPTKTEFDTE